MPESSANAWLRLRNRALLPVPPASDYVVEVRGMQEGVVVGRSQKHPRGRLRIVGLQRLRPRAGSRGRGTRPR